MNIVHDYKEKQVSTFLLHQRMWHLSQHVQLLSWHLGNLHLQLQLAQKKYYIKTLFLKFKWKVWLLSLISCNFDWCYVTEDNDLVIYRKKIITKKFYSHIFYNHFSYSFRLFCILLCYLMAIQSQYFSVLRLFYQRWLVLMESICLVS